MPYVCDHSDDGAVDALFAHVFDREGRLDVLVNNAYGGTDLDNAKAAFKPFYDRPVSSWDKTNTVGLRSNYVAMVSACSRWVQRKERGGLVVNITSAVTCGYQFDVVYGTSKAGLDRLTADTAREMKPHGVAVVSLFPGAARTEYLEQAVLPGGPLHGNPNFKEMESVEFMGRGIAAMAADATVLRRLSGRVVMSPELAEMYGFTDVDGKVPWGFLRPMRKMLGFPPAQYSLRKADLRPVAKL